MSDPRYDIVFCGQVLEGMSLDEVRQNLTGVLQIDASKVERLLSHAPVVIKRGIVLEAGVKLAEVFRSAGLVCEMRPTESSPGVEPGVSPTTGGDADAKVAWQDAITCPKCGFEQRDSTECARCGIIFSKFRQYSISAVEHASAESDRKKFDSMAGAERARVWTLLLLLLVVAFGAYHFWMSLGIKHPPGILVAAVPRQVVIQGPHPWVKGKKVVVPLAEFSLTARVVSKERYRFDAGADLSPIDLVLGWGPMSDQGILDDLDIAQGGRRFAMFPHSDGPHLPLSLLMECSSNMHMIPADNGIKDALVDLRPGEVIELAGYLVGIQESGQWTWVSSLTRSDTGDGACEVVWVSRLRTLTEVKPTDTVTPLDSRSIIAQKMMHSRGGR
jgi:hypothetical protein